MGFKSRLQGAPYNGLLDVWIYTVSRLCRSLSVYCNFTGFEGSWRDRSTCDYIMVMPVGGLAGRRGRWSPDCLVAVIWMRAASVCFRRVDHFLYSQTFRIPQPVPGSQVPQCIVLCDHPDESFQFCLSVCLCIWYLSGCIYQSIDRSVCLSLYLTVCTCSSVFLFVAIEQFI